MKPGRTGRGKPHVGLLLAFYSWLSTYFRRLLAGLLMAVSQATGPVWVELMRRLPAFRAVDPIPTAAEPVRPPDVLGRLVAIPACAPPHVS